jgi:hypothetical protein
MRKLTRGLTVLAATPLLLGGLGATAASADIVEVTPSNLVPQEDPYQSYCVGFDSREGHEAVVLNNPINQQQRLFVVGGPYYAGLDDCI